MEQATDDGQRLTSEKPAVNLFEYLKTSRGSVQSSSDVLIKCHDGVLLAHQLILASISPMLYTEFCQNKYEETITICMPGMAASDMSSYLDAIYSCQDLASYSDINKLLGFRYASTNKQEILSTEEKPHHFPEHYVEQFDATDVVDTDMKEELDSEDEATFYKYRRSHNSVSNDLADFIDDSEDEQKQSSRKKTKLNSSVKKASSGVRPKRSKVWKYYIVDPGNPVQCICQICQESVSYNNQGTSTMIKHLQIAHTIILETIARKSSTVKRPYKVKLKKEPVVDPETGLIIKHAPSEVRKKRRKEVWQHFESFPQDNTRARCKLCSQIIEMKTHSVTIDLVKHLNTHEIKLELETCSICGKTFDERVKRRHHEKMHTSMKTHPCQHCGKLFRDNSAKERHERTHTGEKPFQVSVNQKSCVLFYYSVFKFQCTVCDRRFNSKYHVKAHMPVHTGETPFHCEICGLRFKYLKSKHNHKCVQNEFR